MSHFLLEIITPTKIAFSEQVDLVTAPSVDGQIGILPHHIPLLARLTEGEVKITKDNNDFYLAIGSGFIEVTKDKVILLVTSAYRADEINEKEVKEAIERAKRAFEEKRGETEMKEAQEIFRRSTIALNILRKRRRSPQIS